MKKREQMRKSKLRKQAKSRPHKHDWMLTDMQWEGRSYWCTICEKSKFVSREEIELSQGKKETK